MREISKDDKKPRHDRGGIGREIVREALACHDCAKAGLVPDFCPHALAEGPMT